MTEDKRTVQEAMVQAAQAVGAVAKNLRNKESGYSARSIDDVLNAVHAPLTEAGLVLVPHVIAAEYATVEVGTKRTPMREATLRVRYRFIGPAGDHLDVVTVGEALDSADKATNKALSAALKMALIQAFTIPIAGEDADQATPERAPAQQPARRRRAKPAEEEPVVETPPARVAAMRERIEALDSDHEALLRQEWKDAGLPGIDHLAPDALERAEALIGSVVEYQAGAQAAVVAREAQGISEHDIAAAIGSGNEHAVAAGMAAATEQEQERTEAAAQDREGE